MKFISVKNEKCNICDKLILNYSDGFYVKSKRKSIRFYHYDCVKDEQKRIRINNEDTDKNN